MIGYAVGNIQKSPHGTKEMICRPAGTSGLRCKIPVMNDWAIVEDGNPDAPFFRNSPKCFVPPIEIYLCSICVSSVANFRGSGRDSIGWFDWCSGCQ